MRARRAGRDWPSLPLHPYPRHEGHDALHHADSPIAHRDDAYRNSEVACSAALNKRWGEPPADGTFAARCPREAFGTILVAAKPAKKYT
jgi:hypothetical protein